MLNSFIRKLKLAFSDPEIRFRILFLTAALALFRLLASVPIPGVDKNALASFFASNQFFGLLNIFSGGGLSNLSIVMLGVGPYITASIIMQLGTIIFPQVKQAYFEEGESGRAKFIGWSRLLTIPIAILQGVGFLFLLESQGIVAHLSTVGLIANIALIVAGSMLLMWLGELVTEFGIGNGVSLIILAGILASVPSSISQTLFAATAANIPAYLAFTALGLAMIYAVVVVSDAERSIPIAYARAVRGAAMSQGAATYLPIRLLQAGVIPIIFALSLLLLPQMALSMLGALNISFASSAALWYTAFLSNPWQYGAVYFILVVLFTYFYTAVTFEPHRVAENLQKSGAFVPGVRPGRETEEYIGSVVNRVTLPGATFLGLIAVAPSIIQGLTGITTLVLGGTALLIAVQVALDLAHKIDAQVSLREY
ncbi:preprotein translocase subunit SecY [Candidatus Kaiserbacteria bacterium RIFCSPLOWO2_02_FULL_55_12]|uniref:Protein translocase subunit SecY n=2 Tax=Candidatus Kaiseribacteriota TaxID=1752734 RepID=A0A1F6EZQ5_9BACT|nr:MAG: Protein translocase subunit SecY [Parcubacteria group bacterium GW2011_GWA2_56_21]OGG64162.1 MAG: preprotein translocase subunit SecY [Candidatus Kaiserbacteria bacterium RIFCSPHIGHO2_02_FULL_55_17]OGG79112.1 MAG: preprotein translocase subunit SecY [Candidatus Kaiserbacteria bacterium RIFCSPLOWO2_02_FULL_55_12]